jgi:hypothetical protein
MKTIRLAFVALLAIGLSAATVNAQTGTTAPAKKTTGSTKGTSTKGSTGTKTTTAPASGQHLKKDGTPDMRYKENKQAAAGKEAPKGTTEKGAPKTAPKTKGTAKPTSAKPTK